MLFGEEGKVKARSNGCGLCTCSEKSSLPNAATIRVCLVQQTNVCVAVCQALLDGRHQRLKKLRLLQFAQEAKRGPTDIFVRVGQVLSCEQAQIMRVNAWNDGACNEARTGISRTRSHTHTDASREIDMCIATRTHSQPHIQKHTYRNTLTNTQTQNRD